MFLQDLLQVIPMIFEYSMKMLGIHRLSTLCAIFQKYVCNICNILDTNVVNYFRLQQKWHRIKSHVCRVFWRCLKPFLWKIQMVWGFGNFRGHISFDIFHSETLRLCCFSWNWCTIFRAKLMSYTLITYLKE